MPCSSMRALAYFSREDVERCIVTCLYETEKSKTERSDAKKRTFLIDPDSI